MTAFAYLLERGLTADTDGTKLYVSPSSKLTDDDRKYIRTHKAELMTEIRRRRRRDDVLMQLADNPGVKNAYVVDTGSDPVILAVAIRDSYTFEMTIPADRYEPFKILELFDGTDPEHRS